MGPNPSDRALHTIPGVPARWASIALQNLRTNRKGLVALADPFKVITVDPHEIRRACLMHAETKRQHGSKLHDWGKVIPGDWDIAWRGAPNPLLSQQGRLWRAIHQRYVDGMSWEETGMIDAKMRAIEKKGTVDGCTTREQLVERYHRLDRVFEDIRDNGFRLAHEIKPGSIDNLSVSVGRDGQLFLGTGGGHRLAIACVLGLSQIPVYVLCRHEAWQLRHERCAKEGRAPPGIYAMHQGSYHPDLTDVIDLP